VIKKIAILALTLATTTSLQAQSPADGTWDFTMASPFGSVDATVTMKADGDKLSGEFDLGGGRKLTIEEGSIQGNTISFRLTREGAMSMIYEMSADIEGNSISGTAAAMGTTAPWSMSRGS
jgi:hypothetical protein